jgi:hypothetical protein
LENLWRRPSVNLYGMSLHNQQRGTASLSYGLAPVRHPSGIDPGAQRPPLRQGQGPPTTSGLFVHQGGRVRVPVWRTRSCQGAGGRTDRVEARQPVGTPAG